MTLVNLLFGSLEVTFLLFVFLISVALFIPPLMEEGSYFISRKIIKNTIKKS